MNGVQKTMAAYAEDLGGRQAARHLVRRRLSELAPRIEAERWWREPQIVDEMLDLAASWVEMLTDWERYFLGNISRQNYPLPPKQMAVLPRTVDKIRQYA